MEILMNYIFYISIMVSKTWFSLKKEEVPFKINSTAERNRFRLNGDYKSKQTLFDILYQLIIWYRKLLNS